MNATPLDTSIRERLDAAQRAYAAWGASLPVDGERMTVDQLQRMLAGIAPRFDALGCRAIPSSFVHDDPLLRALPRSLTSPWASCLSFLRDVQARSVMTRLPAFWQSEPAVHASCRAVNAPILVNDPDNIPLATAAIAATKIDTIITAAEHAESCATSLHERGLSMRNWLIVHPASTPHHSSSINRAAHVYQEIHLFPGVPVLTQCPERAKDITPVFHASEEFIWEIEDGRAYVTTVRDDPFPLFRLELPFSVRLDGACACGRMMLTCV